jgi:hypothetical protein
MKRIFALTLASLIALCGYGIWSAFEHVHDLRSSKLEKTAELELETQLIKARFTQDQITAIRFPNNFLIKASSQADASLILQRTVVALAEEANLILTTFGPTRAIEKTTQSNVAFQFEGQANYADVLAFLQALNGSDFPIAISNVVVRRARSRQKDTTDISVFFQMSLWAFWGTGT